MGFFRGREVWMWKRDGRREAKLRPECAGWHPTLPVSIWTSAARIADLVGSTPDLHGEIGKKGRVLVDSDFEFRGGRRRRWSAEWFAHTRTEESH
jgi:hypothetical protein